MTPIARRATKQLLDALDGRVRQGVIRRVDAMERELEFLMSREDRDASFVRSRGWDESRTQVFFVLNSLYQQVLGPLQAAARGGPDGLGGTVPVKHGKTTFDKAAARNVTEALKGFYQIIDELKIQRSWLYANTCRDALYDIANYERFASRV